MRHVENDSANDAPNSDKASSAMIDFLKGLLRNATTQNVDGLRERFTAAYETNVWGDPESRSGPGSRLDSHTVARAITVLPAVVNSFGIKSMADIPCGDFNWMPKVLEGLSVKYRGYDIVTGLIAENKKKYPSFSFDVLDITKERPPECDLIFCKDLLNHLEYVDIANAVLNMKLSKSQYALLSNNFGCQNAELPKVNSGSSRLFDLCAEPFSFPIPIWATDYFGLWRLADISQIELTSLCRRLSAAAK